MKAIRKMPPHTPPITIFKTKPDDRDSSGKVKTFELSVGSVNVFPIVEVADVIKAVLEISEDKGVGSPGGSVKINVAVDVSEVWLKDVGKGVGVRKKVRLVVVSVVPNNVVPMSAGLVVWAKFGPEASVTGLVPALILLSDVGNSTPVTNTTTSTSRVFCDICYK